MKMKVLIKKRQGCLERTECWALEIVAHVWVQNECLVTKRVGVNSRRRDANRSIILDSGCCFCSSTQPLPSLHCSKTVVKCAFSPGFLCCARERRRRAWPLNLSRPSNVLEGNTHPRQVHRSRLLLHTYIFVSTYPALSRLLGNTRNDKRNTVLQFFFALLYFFSGPNSTFLKIPNLMWRISSKSQHGLFFNFSIKITSTKWRRKKFGKITIPWFFFWIFPKRATAFLIVILLSVSG